MFSPEIRYLSGFLTLPVPNLDAAADWYSAALGFSAITSGVERGRPWLHMRRAEGQDLVLVASERGRVLRLRAGVSSVLGALRLRPAGAALGIAVDRDLAEVVSRAAREGARRLRTDGDEGSARVRDPYGYDWVLFSRLPAPRSAPAPSTRLRHGTPFARARARRRAWRRPAGR